MTEADPHEDGSDLDDDGDRTSVLERTAKGTQIMNVKADEPRQRPRTNTLPSMADSARGSHRRFEGALWVGCALAAAGLVLAWQWTRATPASAPNAAPSATVMRLELGLTTKPSADEVLIDGKALAPGQRTVELPCPNGKHVLEIRAANHEPAVRETPCGGRVILELDLLPPR